MSEPVIEAGRLHMQVGPLLGPTETVLWIGYSSGDWYMHRPGEDGARVDRREMRALARAVLEHVPTDEWATR